MGAMGLGFMVKSEHYSQQLLYDLAISLLTEEEICAQHGVSLTDLDRWRGSAVYREDLARAVDYVKRNGLSVELKARMLVEMNLPQLHRFIADPDIPATARVQAFDKLMDLAGYGKSGGSGGGERGPQFVLNFMQPDKAVQATTVRFNDRPILDTQLQAITDAE